MNFYRGQKISFNGKVGIITQVNKYDCSREIRSIFVRFFDGMNLERIEGSELKNIVLLTETKFKRDKNLPVNDFGGSRL